MTEVFGVLILCYLLIGMEAIVRGGILGVLGFLGLILAAYLAHKEFGGWFAPSITFLGGGLGAFVLVYMEFKWLSRSTLGKRLFIEESVKAQATRMWQNQKCLANAVPL